MKRLIDSFPFLILILILPGCTSLGEPTEYNEYDIETLQVLMERGELSAEELVAYYIDRIESIDSNGPALNAIIEMNPNALDIARELDQERAARGPRGPMHGIPVVLKANIDTGDAMETTAGSLALAGHHASQDAFVVAKLRESGAVILAKANLSEWANYRSTKSSSGWSSIGGQTRNPYDPSRNPCGSSSGSGVAVAANLTSVAVGTETDGSVVCPSSVNGIVGIKPSLGLVSRSGIIPIAHSQDTAGPMGRTVKDAALLLNAMVGRDNDDPMGESFPNDLADFAAGLTADALDGKRIGVIENYPGKGKDARVDAIFETSVARMRSLGAILIEGIELDTEGMNAAEGEVLAFEFKTDLNAYLRQSNAPLKTLAEIIAFNRANADRAMPIFQQEILEASQEKGPLTEDDYLEALAQSKKISQGAIDGALEAHNLDALIAPTGGAAWTTDHVNGDAFPGISSSSYAAVSGYASITVPAGYISGLPIGVSFIGGNFTDAKLIRYAYAYEQGSKVRRPPPLD